MVGDRSSVSRRSFLKLAGANLAAVALRFPIDEALWQAEVWPTSALEDLPPTVRLILEKVPQTHIEQDGYLVLDDPKDQALGRVPQARTLWNLERSKPGDRLYNGVPWGIVIHWYGDKENFDRSVEGYLRGFNSMRWADEYLTRTSAHFLVGADAPSNRSPRLEDKSISILQTQRPAEDGWPFLASHLQPLDHLAHKERRQYFVRALYQLRYNEPQLHTLLQDFFDGPRLDPNLRTIAIEVCGYDFEHPQHFPPDQQIANLVSVVWALMKRYDIEAVNILGHHEIQLGKADPGKKFISLIRFLIGAKALLENDLQMKRLVFGQFLDTNGGPGGAVRRYFRFVRDYLILVGKQIEVYEWEAACNYWLTWGHFAESNIPVARSFQTPFPELQYSNKLNFLHPENHEGIDLLIRGVENRYNKTVTAEAHLVADGVCLFTGEIDRCNPGQSVIFSHCQPDGARILTVFGNLSELGSLRAGESYPAGTRVGSIESTRTRWNPSLHFAVAFGATWDTDLGAQAYIPINAGTNWILSRYMDPLDYLQRQLRHL
jgi:N-acetylmuramoyl-L-alanine amidase